MIPDIAFTWRYKGFKSRTLSLTTLGTTCIQKIEIRVSGIGILASEIQEISRQRLLGGCIVPSAECRLGNGLCPASFPFRRSWMLPVVSRYVIAAEVGGEINVLLPSVSYAKETLKSPLHDPFLPSSGRLEFLLSSSRFQGRVSPGRDLFNP